MTLSLHRIQLPLKAPVASSNQVIDVRQSILLEYQYLGTSIWSEAPAFSTSDYMPETHDVVWQRLVQDGDAILNALHAGNITELINQKEQPIYSFALDGLYCQLMARQQHQSFMDFLGSQPAKVDGTAMIGIQPTASEYHQIIDKVYNAGYRAIKFKVSPQVIHRVAGIIESIQSRFDYICVDANGSFDDATWPILECLPQEITIEQPVHRNNNELLFKIIKELPNQCLLDESIRHIDDISNFQGLGVGIMLKPVCVGGLRQTVKMIHCCNDFSIPCGVSGYLDSGIGRYLQWIIAQHPGLWLRPDFVWSDYYFHKDVITVHDGIDTDFPTTYKLDPEFIIESVHITD